MKDEINAILQLAFEAGKWAGQVELEEHYDKEQYGSAITESLYSRKTSMPKDRASEGREVTIRLRSQEWRDGVKKSSHEYMEKAIDYLVKIINKQEKRK